MAFVFVLTTEFNMRRFLLSSIYKQVTSLYYSYLYIVLLHYISIAMYLDTCKEKDIFFLIIFLKRELERKGDERRSLTQLMDKLSNYLSYRFKCSAA
jgi:hypothetical protein